MFAIKLSRCSVGCGLLKLRSCARRLWCSLLTTHVGPCACVVVSAFPPLPRISYYQVGMRRGTAQSTSDAILQIERRFVNRYLRKEGDQVRLESKSGKLSLRGVSSNSKGQLHQQGGQQNRYIVLSRVLTSNNRSRLT